MKPSCQLQMVDKEMLIKSIWLHYVFCALHVELEQLRKGLLKTLQMETFVHSYPREFYNYLVGSTMFDVMPEYILDCFTIRYSDQGSNDRTHEEAIIMHWTDYVMECEGKNLALCVDINGLRFTIFTDVSIADILHFVSGATKLPATGFTTMPSIRFSDVDGFPFSSTCDISITIPRSFGLLSYAEFKSRMDMSILDSFGFGNP